MARTSLSCPPLDQPLNYRHRWGERVALGRAGLGLSQDRLADATGVTQQAISAIERGESSPSEELKVRIAHALNVSPERVFPLGDVEIDLRFHDPAEHAHPTHTIESSKEPNDA